MKFYLWKQTLDWIRPMKHSLLTPALCISQEWYVYSIVWVLTQSQLFSIALIHEGQFGSVYFYFCTLVLKLLKYVVLLLPFFVVFEKSDANLILCFLQIQKMWVLCYFIYFLYWFHRKMWGSFGIRRLSVFS